jgi:hypothetical protein
MNMNMNENYEVTTFDFQTWDENQIHYTIDLIK